MRPNPRLVAALAALCTTGLAGVPPGLADAHPGSKKASSPANPMACMRQAGLRRVAPHGRGYWQGLGARNRAVIVDGPYKNPAAARAAVRTLTGISIAEQGGRYEVSATLHSALNTTVDAVATCLSRQAARAARR